MRDMCCQPEWEELVVSAVWSGEKSDELEAHLSECAACRDALETESRLFEKTAKGASHAPASAMASNPYRRKRTRTLSARASSLSIRCTRSVACSSMTVRFAITIGSAVPAIVTARNPTCRAPSILTVGV